MTPAAWPVAAALALFTVRRSIFWLASLAPPRAAAPAWDRSVTVLVAARDEATNLPRLLAALERLDYPRGLLHFVIASDASVDGTAEIVCDWANRTPNSQALALPVRHGKGGALRAALAAAPGTELVAVFDADSEPRPDALARLVGAFGDPGVGAACGYPDPGHAHRSHAARYAALERWVSHLVTFAGKDRLDLQPPVIGVLCCVRAAALAAAGGFPAGSDVEDIELTLALSRSGWRTRWVRDAISREDVPQTLATLRLQRLRWSRGLMASAPRANGIEGLLAATGYLDRIALVAGLALTLVGAMPAWIVTAYVTVPLLVIATALHRAAARDWPGYVAAVGVMAAADIAMTCESVIAGLRGVPVRWKA